MNNSRNLSFVVLVGSIRKESYHAAIASSLQTLVPENVKLTLLGSVGDIPHYDADLQAEGFPAAVLAMGKAIREADGVVVVTPEYNYSVPGVLKNALDWLSRLPEQPFTGKPVSIMTGSPGPIGGARAQYHLRQIMVFLDAIVFNRPEVMVGQFAGKIDASAGQITDETTRTFIASHLESFAAFARRLG